MPGANFNEIVVFMAVADAGSFVAGGHATGLTRSAASKAVGRLEDRLGVRLLNRTTRSLSLTDEGRAFYDGGQTVVRAIDDAEASVVGSAGTPRGLLRLTAPDAYGRLMIAPLIGEYLAAWPDLRMEVSFTDRQSDIVEEGFDLAIRIGDPPLDTRLISRVVARYGWALVGSPAYLAKRGEPANIDAIGDHDRLVFSSRGRRQSWRFRSKTGTWTTAKGHSRLRLDSGEALCDAAVAGLGLAFLPHFVVEDDLGAGRLRQVLPELDGGDAMITAIYPSRRLLEPRVRRFIDLMVERLGS